MYSWGVFNPLIEEFRWININAVPQTRSGETAPFQVFTTFQDITERKRVEEERKRLALAVEQSAENIFITDAHGHIEYVNPSFEKTAGYSRAECLGKTPRLVKSGQQDHTFYADLWRIITSGKSWQGRLVNMKKDGSLYTEDGSISPVVDASGKVTNFVSVKQDVSHTLAIEQEKEELQALFLQSQKMESIGRLAGGVAHDFNNFLSVINGITDEALNLIDDGQTPERGDIEMVREAGERAAALTRQLLAFSRKQAIDPQVINLSELVEAMVPMIRRLVGEYIDVRTLVAKNLNIVADQGQMEQVLMNLCVNARDAMPHGGALAIETKRVELDISYTRKHPNLNPGAYVVLTIVDSGVGLDTQTQEQMFEPFFTAKGDGRTGLGLATVFGIVRQASGDIQVRSETNHGTTFEIYFPATENSPCSSDEVSAVGAESGTERVLVVDDDDGVRKIVCRQLSSAGYTVISAANGEEALQQGELLGESLQLMLTDVVMPKLGGRELAKRVARQYPQLKILFMSGWADGAIVHNDSLDGKSFIAKPFNAKRIRQAVRRLLDEESSES